MSVVTNGLLYGIAQSLYCSVLNCIFIEPMYCSTVPGGSLEASNTVKRQHTYNYVHAHKAYSYYEEPAWGHSLA